MTLADIFIAELDKYEQHMAPAHASIAKIGRKLAEEYKANLETLAGITRTYVAEMNKRQS